MSLPSPSQPPPDRSFSSTEEIEELMSSDRPLLSSAEVRADPILTALAKQQRGSTTPTPSNHTFKARPAPTNMRDNVGPRMTKAATLRQGLPWEEKPRARPSTAGTGEARPFGTMPGHKRNSLSVNIKSLAAPAVVPRQTKASQLRTGAAISTVLPVRRDAATVLADNKVKAAEEKARRRASIAIPASLSAPQIAPRGNRSSELRTGVKGPEMPRSSSTFRLQSALSPITSTNVSTPTGPVTGKEEKNSRRASVIGMVKSLGAPSIQPRLNKAAMLRAPVASNSTIPTRSISTISTAATTVPSRSKLPSSMSTQSFTARPAPSTDAKGATGPRLTKSSLLRAGLGAKVQTR